MKNKELRRPPPIITSFATFFVPTQQKFDITNNIKNKNGIVGWEFLNDGIYFPQQKATAPPEEIPVKQPTTKTYNIWNNYFTLFSLPNLK